VSVRHWVSLIIVQHRINNFIFFRIRRKVRPSIMNALSAVGRERAMTLGFEPEAACLRLSLQICLSK
jgi:hypothetical protein